jgi:preprotein translocase subunit YajC
MPSRTLSRPLAIGAAVVVIAGGGYGIASAASSNGSAGAGIGQTATATATATPGANARSGPAAGGVVGTVSSVSTSSFTVTTSAGQKMTIKKSSSTSYRKGTHSTSASAVAKGKPVLVLGTVNGTTITATKVIVQPASDATATFTPSKVIPFKRGAPSTPKQDGEIPANYTEGSGTIVSGTTANKATEAALAAYPGGVVDRVVKLSDGEYEIFLSKSYKVAGAN